MAEMITVRIVDAKGNCMSSQPLKFDPPEQCAVIIQELVEGGHGAGHLLSADGVTVTRNKQVSAGDYTYHVTAAAQPPQAPADAAPTSKLELLVSQIPDATAAKVAAALPRPMVQVTASGCNSGTAQDVLNMLNFIIKVEAGCLVPCCLKDVLQPLKSNIPRFSWPVHGKENAQDTVSAAVKYLKTNVLPEGTFIWPVQGLNWLTTVVDCGPPGYLCIVNSQTDYIVFMEGSDSQILKLVEGLSKVSGGLKQNLLPLVPWMVALVEAKTPTQLTQRNHVCRCQALLQYVALNHHLSASTAPMAVLLTDFNSYHTVHSGGTAKTYFDNKEMKCIHITSPAGMTSVPETKPAHASSTSHARSAAAAPSAGQPAATALAPASADLTTIQFVQTVLVQGLKARQSETAGLPLPIQDGLVSVVHERDQPGDDDDDGGGGGRGGGNDMEDSSQNDMEGGSQGDHDMHDGAVGDVGGDGVAGYPRTQQAHGSLQLNLEVNTFTISRKGGSKDHQDAHSNDESNSSDVSGSVDEALLEAAEDNIKAQQVMALLRHPAVYHGLGLTQAPRSYTPLSKEEFWGSCRLLPISDD